jgi:hypothetical protein
MWIHVGLFCVVFFLLLSVVVLGIQFRALCLLGKHSTTWATIPALFVLVIYLFFMFWPRAVLDCDHVICVSIVAGITDMYHYTQLVCWDERGVLLTFSLGWPWILNLPISACTPHLAFCLFLFCLFLSHNVFYWLTCSFIFKIEKSALKLFVIASLLLFGALGEESIGCCWFSGYCQY